MENNQKTLISAVVLLGAIIVVSAVVTEKSGDSVVAVAKSLKSDFDKEPVVCTTVGKIVDQIEGENSWSSCSDGCPSKFPGNSSGQKIMVDVRHKGKSIRFENCEEGEFFSCVPPKPLLCYKGDCQTMNGIFSCNYNETSTDSYAQCKDLAGTHHCNFTKLDNETISCHKIKTCLYLDGVYNCNVGECKRADITDCRRKPCDDIDPSRKSVIIRQGHKIFTGKCGRAINEATGEEIWPLLSNGSTGAIPTLLMFCAEMWVSSNDSQTFIGSDCFNGTQIDPYTFGTLTDSKSIRLVHSQVVDKNEANRESDLGHGLIGPTESDLTIYNNTRLFINYEGCVEEGSCQQFYTDFGVPDGLNLAQSRFECYYSPNLSFGVLLKIEE